MFVFVKQIFFGCSALNTVQLKCVSMSNQEYRLRPKIIHINSNGPTFYPQSTEVNKCSGICNNSNNPYSKLCVAYVVKNMNVKVFNLMSRTNETRYIK